MPTAKNQNAIIISDIHCGFKYGLVPPGWRLTAGQDVDPTVRFQEYLFDCFTHFTETCPKADILIINGDLLHGEHYKLTKDVISADLYDQAQMAIETLTPLRKKCDRVWIVKGTPMHMGEGSEAVNYVATELGAEKWGAGRRAGVSLYLDWQGLTLGVSHHQTRGWVYSAGSLERTILMQMGTEAQGKLPQTDILIRSHLHCGRVVRAYGKWAIATACWTVVSPYAEKVMEHSRAHLFSDIGGLVLSYKKGGSVGFHFEEYKACQEEVRKA